MTKVALSGASGNIGQVLRPALLKMGVALRSAGGRRALTALAPEEDVCNGDLRDAAFVDRLLAGVDVLIHMAGTSVERPLPEVIENNLRALHSVYEGARRHRVRRIVFASSNHAVGMHSVETRLDLDCDLRPDGFYGLSKVWGEAMARMVLGQARYRGHLAADRHRNRKANRVPSSEHMAGQRRPDTVDHPLHHRAGYRLPCGLGCLGQHAQLLGQCGRGRTWLSAHAECRRLCGGNPEPAESTRPGGTALPGWRLRHHRLHAA